MVTDWGWWQGKEGGRLQGTWRCIPGLDHCGGKTLGSGAAAEAPQREEPNQKMCFSIALAKNYADGEEWNPLHTAHGGELLTR